MPLLKVMTSVKLSEEKTKNFLKDATEVLVSLGKKESHAMVVLEKVDASMGGEQGPTVFAEFRSMVFQTHEQNNEMSNKLCELFRNELNVPIERTFINIIQVPESCWGWQGGIVVWDNSLKKWVVR
jgi:phenylpyruvate tautomerase